ncbi:TorF family putative porin [Rhodanobacter sp. L36]|uniref:TorF family putative porin n=1 Tax=Rhodanobacter sp. L36 TaxID=1747221 RepID=UPI00131D11BC|nr:TorF family putative porin [Rhodanobacter sp. L36]
MKRCTQWITVMAMAWVFSTPCQADDAPASKVIGSVSIVNDYLFRGLSQTNQKPAVQPGIEYDHASGWYVGAWGSNVSWLSDVSTSEVPVSSSVELDFYTGYRGSFNADWSYDVGLYEYYYPGSYPAGFTRPYTTEAYASLGFKGITLKYSHAFSNLFGFADSKNSDYLDLSYNYEFSPSWTLNAHVGHQDVSNNPGFAYYDWKLGVTKAFASGYSIALGYYDTNAARSGYTNRFDHYVGRATGVLSLAKSF